MMDQSISKLLVNGSPFPSIQEGELPPLSKKKWFIKFLGKKIQKKVSLYYLYNPNSSFIDMKKLNTEELDKIESFLNLTIRYLVYIQAFTSKGMNTRLKLSTKRHELPRFYEGIKGRVECWGMEKYNHSAFKTLKNGNMVSSVHASQIMDICFFIFNFLYSQGYLKEPERVITTKGFKRWYKNNRFERYK